MQLRSVTAWWQPATGWFRANPFAADALLAATLLALALAFSINDEPEGSQRAYDIAGRLLLVAAFVPLAWRRVWPVAAMWATILPTMAFWVADYPDNAGPNLLIALYSVGAHVERPRSIRHAAASVAVMIAVTTAGVLVDEEGLPVLSIPANMIIFVTAFLLGDNMRNRRNYLVELEEKAERAQAHLASEAQRAVSEERARIARELHDVIAHSMSVMVVQAGAARRVLAHDPDRAVEAMDAVEQTGRESLAEMRRVLGVLRNDGDAAELVPAPGLDDVDRLVSQCEEAGLPVEVATAGEVRRLAPGLEQSAYRVVQESLTNSLKHAGPAQAVVTLEYQPSCLVVDVADDGRGASAAPGSGQGLVGMRERVEAFGGHLSAGPRAGGGYQVTATFPIADRS